MAQGLTDELDLDLLKIRYIRLLLFRFEKGDLIFYIIRMRKFIFNVINVLRK